MLCVRIRNYQSCAGAQACDTATENGHEAAQETHAKRAETAAVPGPVTLGSRGAAAVKSAQVRSPTFLHRACLTLPVLNCSAEVAHRNAQHASADALLLEHC